VTIIEIDIKIVIFTKIERNRYCDFFGASDSTLILYRPRRAGDQRRRSHNGFYTPVSLITPSVEEFISSTPSIGAKTRNQIEIEFFTQKSNRNQKEKTTIVTSLLVQ